MEINNVPTYYVSILYELHIMYCYCLLLSLRYWAITLLIVLRSWLSVIRNALRLFSVTLLIGFLFSSYRLPLVSIMHHLPFKESATTRKRFKESNTQRGKRNCWVWGISYWRLVVLLKYTTIDNSSSKKQLIMRRPAQRNLLFKLLIDILKKNANENLWW